MTSKVLRLENFRSLDHEVDQWNRGLSNRAIKYSLVFEIKVDDVIVVRPHSLTHIILVVDQLRNTGQPFINIVLPRFRKTDSNWLIKNYFELWIEFRELA